MSNGIQSKKTVLDKWQSLSLLFSSLTYPAFLVAEIEERAEADAGSSQSGVWRAVTVGGASRWERTTQ
jgi:hypothetical protein